MQPNPPTWPMPPVPPSEITADAPAAASGESAFAPAIGVGTLLRFLLGRPDAILQIARSRSAIWVGLAFVVSAGLAREYDHEDLLREPWHLLIPAAASIGLSFVLYVAFWPGMGRLRRPRFWPGYRGFLTLFWMTAPLAWLYAVPYERMLSAGASVEANLLTLAFVAGWRVVLISRVIAVVTGRSFAGVMWVVLAIADVVLQATLVFAPLPILSVMGGVSLSEGDLLLAKVKVILLFFGMPALVVLVPGAFVALFAGRGSPAADVSAPVSRARRSLAYWAVVSVLGWAAALPFTQPEQRRRADVERLLKNGQIPAAIDLLSSTPRNAFPPHWDPPPRVGYPDERPDLLDVMEVLVDGRGSPWVRQLYVDKLFRGYLRGMSYRWHTEADQARVTSLVKRLPEGPTLPNPGLERYGAPASAPSGPTTRPTAGPTSGPG